MKKNVLKVISFLLCLCITFGLVQKIITPKYVTDSTMIVDGFYALPENSLDVLSIGSSQMFCSIHSGILKEEYGIENYDFGVSGQRVAATALYLEKALKTQTPKVVLFEVCSIFVDSGKDDASSLSWSFDPLPLTAAKLRTLYEIFDGDLRATLAQALPLWQWHSRWGQISEADFTWPFQEHPNPTGGFLYRSETEAVSFLYNVSDPNESCNPIPEDTVESIRKIRDLCEKNGIRLIAFKAPNAIWNKANSRETKALMDTLGIQFVDCLDYIEEIGIDPNTDFFDGGHLNTSGAEKTTRFIAQYLQ